MSENIDIVELKNNTDIADVIGRYVDLKKDGPHYKGCCPFHNEETPSFVVTPKKGLFKCFGCGKAGDVIKFLEYQGMPFKEAVKYLSDPNNTAAVEHGTIIKEESKKKKQASVWRQIVPAVPVPGMKFIFTKHGEASMKWAYHDANGSLVGYVCRFELPGGKKETLPYIYATDGTRKQWKWLGFEKPRPLYDLHILEKTPTKSVLLVEGEKAAEAAKKLFPQTNVTTWIGGSNAVKSTNFSSLRGRVVILWPDNDAPGFKAMLEINDIIKEYAQTRWVINEDFPKGWDIADSNWTPEEAREYTSTHIVSVPERESHLATFKIVVAGNPKHDVIDESNEEKVAATVIATAAEKKKYIGPPNNNTPGKFEMHGQSEYFRILGSIKEGNGMLYNFYSYGSKTIISLAPSSMTKNNLIQLASLEWWKNTFPDKNGFSIDSAVDYLIQKSSEFGTFNKRLVRGRGAWIDDKRVVIHAGNKLYIDGKEVSLKEYKSKYIYEAAGELNFNLVEPVKIADGKLFIDLLGKLNWLRAVDAYLLAGWCVIAPVCGALDWRPHIWLIGASGTGKTTLINKIILKLLGEVGLQLEGETTEPGLRQLLKNDALPVIFDEAEADDQRAQQRVQSLLSLMRSASSNASGLLAKGSSGGNANTYQTRSTFLLSSVASQIVHASDRSRITSLELISAKDSEAQSRYESFLKLQSELVTDDFSIALRSRTVRMLPVILENIKIFSAAAALVIGGNRTGDQYGALLAGAYSLVSDKLITFDAAAEWLQGKDWSEEKSNELLRDEVRLISHLLQQIVKIAGEYTNLDRTIGELVQVGMILKNEFSYSPEQANDQLKRLGMKVVDNWLYISNSDIQIKKLLYNTPWANNHNKILMRLTGAESVESCRFASGVTTRAVKLPKDLLFKDMEILTLPSEPQDMLALQTELEKKVIGKGIGSQQEDLPF